MTDVQQTPRPFNRLGLDYREEADRFGPPVAPIIDVHTHINGRDASEVYRDVCDCYGIERCYSMSQLDQADNVLEALGDRVRFIAVPNYMSDDKRHAFTQGYIENITAWHGYGSRICKFWCAPRGRDFGIELGEPDLLTLHSPWRRRQMEHAMSLGMMMMIHIADPDTWFATRYTDASLYGTKAEQYEPLEALIEAYRETPWLLAHMGGWPEDLAFLDGLLNRHPNVCLDTSATKWMVRELSKHPREDLLIFFERYRGRILFGSDIVTTDLHLTDEDDDFGRGAQASSRQDAFDLYASRYWALRTLFETSYDEESPIADPDLAMVRPDRNDAMSAPLLMGKSLPPALLTSIYRDAAMSVVDRWHAEHP